MNFNEILKVDADIVQIVFDMEPSLMAKRGFENWDPSFSVIDN